VSPEATQEVDLTLTACLDLVRRFHERIKAPIAATPQTLNCDAASALAFSIRLTKLSKDLASASNGMHDVLLGRAALAVEELGEWLAAHANGDLVGAGDAIGDRLYVLLGDAVASGLPLSEILFEIHQSNMTKFAGVTTGVGRGVKGPAYSPPDIAGVLARYTG
jgi:predicted HAD superfamily Cof-like phosphohydrolase